MLYVATELELFLGVVLTFIIAGLIAWIVKILVERHVKNDRP